MKGPDATRVGAGPKVLGIGWDRLPGLPWLVEPVTVRSPKARLPNAVHPDKAAAPAKSPTIAAALSALLVTRLRINPLVRRYSMEMTMRR